MLNPAGPLYIDSFRMQSITENITSSISSAYTSARTMRAVHILFKIILSQSTVFSLFQRLICYYHVSTNMFFLQMHIRRSFNGNITSVISPTARVLNNIGHCTMCLMILLIQVLSSLYMLFMWIKYLRNKFCLCRTLVNDILHVYRSSRDEEQV